MILAAAFLFTFPGAPAVYYGDEIGMEGGEDPDCRRPFPWDERAWTREVLDTFRHLIQLRRSEPCLKRGEIEFIRPVDRVDVADKLQDSLLFRWQTEEEQIVSALNTGKEGHRLRLPSSGVWVDLLTQETISSVLRTLPPRDELSDPKAGALARQQ